MLERKCQKQNSIYVIPWTILLVAPLCGIFLGDSQNETFGAWLLLISVFIFGLPHGACDLWILQKASERYSNSLQKLTKYFSIYLFLVILTIAIWLILPGFALVGFLFLTVWHFGSGDAIWEKTNNFQWILNSLGRGLIVIFAPIAFHENLSKNVLYGLTDNTENLIVTFILFLAPLFVIAGLITLIFESVLFSRDQSFRQQSIKWTEVGLILIMFWFTSPLLAVTFYLIGVHSWRHILRLDLYEARTSRKRSASSILNIITNFHRKALPMTILSMVGLFAIVLIFQIGTNDIFQISSAYLILLSALTVPHAILISWMETQNSVSINQ